MRKFKALMMCLLSFAFVSAYAEDGVSRSAFTSAIEEREPVDQITELTNDKTDIYFFTEIKGMKGQVITHRWLYNDQMHAELKFNVGGDRWRVWSNKKLRSDWLGEWTVSIVDEGDNVLIQKSINYVEFKKTNNAIESN